MHEIKADLDTLNITELPDDFVEPFEIGPLPKNGDKLKLRFLRVFDHIEMENKSIQYNSGKKNDGTGDPKYTMEMESMLVSVNDNPLDSFAKHNYITTMIGMDSSYFHNKVEKMFYGVHRLGTISCPDKDCNGIILYTVAPDENFFRAAFDD